MSMVDVSCTSIPMRWARSRDGRILMSFFDYGGVTRNARMNHEK